VIKEEGMATDQSATGITPPIQRIAVFRGLFLGDLLVAVPAFRALRSGYPHAEITLIGLPWARSFAERYHALIDRFIEFAGYPGINEVPVIPERVERFVAEQRHDAYDLVIQMHGSGGTSNPFVVALGGRNTVGCYLGTPPPGLTGGVPYPEGDHEIFRNLALPRFLGCPDLSTQMEFPLFEEDMAQADMLLGTAQHDHRPIIALHPGAKPPARRWPAASFAATADTLTRRHGARMLLTGGPGEEKIVDAVARQMTSEVLNLAGKTSLGGLAAVIARADLFISNDTGPAHLACAVDTPSITIFGPADYPRWAPLDQHRHPTVRHPVACSPCSYWECPIDHRCLTRIAPRGVIGEAARLLAQGGIACAG